MDEINTFSKEASDLARENAANLQRLEQAGQEQAEWRRRFELDRKGADFRISVSLFFPLTVFTGENAT